MVASSVAIPFSNFLYSSENIENRKKYPANKKAPLMPNIKPTNIYKESCEYVEKHFSNNPGEISKTPIYPTDFKNSKL